MVHASFFDNFVIAPSRFIEAVKAKEIEIVFDKQKLEIGDNVGILHDYVDWKASRSDDGTRRLFEEIIKRESGWHWWKCNQTTVYGCAAGQGLTQVVFGTEKTCEKFFNRTMNMLDPYDNIDCGWWLLTERGVKRGIANWDDMSWKQGIAKAWGSGPYQLSLFGIR